MADTAETYGIDDTIDGYTIETATVTKTTATFDGFGGAGRRTMSKANPRKAMAALLI